MRRFHLFELEDQSWFPNLIRDAGCSYLAFAARVAGHSKLMAPMLRQALDRSGEDRIVDLCSGGSGPLPGILEVFESSAELAPKVIPNITLTDLYPNRAAFADLSSKNARISVIYDSVNAMNVPSNLPGLRTLFSGFHHFRPDDARRILSDAVEDGAPIAIFEIVARHPLAMLSMLFVPIVTLLVLPFLRPFRWGWIPFTYLLPVIPFFILWDGFVSCLRCYGEAELRAMTREIDAPGYDWEIGPIKMVGVPWGGIYLIGTPAETTRATGSNASTPIAGQRLG